MIATVPPEINTEDKLSMVLKALSSSSRRRILALLREGEECVCHIEAATGYRQAYISQQLKLLKDVGLVIDQRRGWNIFYRVINPQIFTVLDEIAGLSGQAPEPVTIIKKTCSCPKYKPVNKKNKE